MRAISFLFYLSNEDWDLLCELATENNTPVAKFAEQLMSSKLTEIRDEIRYVEETQQELDTLAEFMEKPVEEALS